MTRYPVQGAAVNSSACDRESRILFDLNAMAALAWSTQRKLCRFILAPQRLATGMTAIKVQDHPWRSGTAGKALCRPVLPQRSVQARQRRCAANPGCPGPSPQPPCHAFPAHPAIHTGGPGQRPMPRLVRMCLTV